MKLTVAANMQQSNYDVQVFQPYGTAPEFHDGKLQRGMTPREAIMTVFQIILLIVIPSSFFAGLPWTLISFPAYQHPSMRSAIVVASASAVVLMIVAALLSRGKWLRKGGRLGHAETRYMKDFVWWGALAALSSIAFVAGLSVGDVLAKSMNAYYDVTALSNYDNVDPARSQGKELIDAGRVMFMQGSRLNLNRSMSIKSDGITYCVAPIVARVSEPLPATFDFWAVGQNCCADAGKDFHCGAARDHTARGGIRLLDDEKILIYRKAVEEAESVHRMQSVRPLFFEWVADPIGELVSLKDHVFQSYCTYCLVFAASTLTVVCTGYIYFWVRQFR